MASRRVARVASRIRFLVSSIIQRELNDPRVGFVTILSVEPTMDLREAKVLYSVLGDSGVKSRTRHAIDSARGFIQREVGRNLETRVTPRLRFILDETQDRISRFGALIEKVVHDDQEAAMSKKPARKKKKARASGKASPARSKKASKKARKKTVRKKTPSAGKAQRSAAKSAVRKTAVASAEERRSRPGDDELDSRALSRSPEETARQDYDSFEEEDMDLGGAEIDEELENDVEDVDDDDFDEIDDDLDDKNEERLANFASYDYEDEDEEGDEDEDHPGDDYYKFGD